MEKRANPAKKLAKAIRKQDEAFCKLIENISCMFEHLSQAQKDFYSNRLATKEDIKDMQFFILIGFIIVSTLIGACTLLTKLNFI